MFRIGVLVSGEGTNLQVLIDACASGTLNGVISKVAADRPCRGVKRAREAGIPAVLVDRKIYGRKLSLKLAEEFSGEADLVVLAGFLSILDEPFLNAFKGRIVNIHPSLLPAYGGKGLYGLKVHRAVLKAGEKESGCTVHFVEEGIDTGRIIKQIRVPVKEGDTPESLGKRIIKEEHSLIVSAVGEVLKQMEKIK